MGRAFREATVALWRTGAVGVVSSLAVGTSLLLVGLFVQLIDAAQGLGATVKDRVEVDVYLKDRAKRSDAQKLAQVLADLPDVSEVTYVDNKQAAQEFRTMFGDDLLDALSANPLPASIRVRFDPSGDVTASARRVIETVEGHALVENTEGGEAWLSGLDQALDVATGLVILLGVVLCVACAFAVSNTSKLMVLAQREAIEVMQLVGATNAFVRLTFLIGGALQGTIGGIMAALVLFATAGVTESWFLSDASLSVTWLGLSLVTLGFGLGVIGSWASLNRVLQAITA